MTTTAHGRRGITPREAARITGQSTSTLARYYERGYLTGYTLPSGHRRYYLDSVRSIVAPAGVDLVARTAVDVEGAGS